ncbi:MAG: sensor histidine kinase [Armatimonadota bacterium]
MRAGDAAQQKVLEAGPTLACARAVERMARAAGRQRVRTAAAVVAEATELLECDAALIVARGRSADELTVLAGEAPGVGLIAGEVVGIEAAAELLDHPRSSAQGRSGTAAGLSRRLGELGLRSWALEPVGAESALVVASQGDRPCRCAERYAALTTCARLVLRECATAGDEDPAQAAALERMAMVTSLTSGVAHSLGNLFGAMLGTAHLLGAATVEPTARELLRRLEQSIDDGAELMRTLAVFAQPALAGPVAHLELGRLVGELVELMGALCAAWPELRRLRLQAPSENGPDVWGSADQLREALASIIGNAIGWAGPSGRITVSLHADGAFARVAVRDDGPGMGAETARRAAEPFFTTRPAPHEGLGLTVARGVALAHRGSLKITRPVEGGALVTLSVRRDRPDEADAPRRGRAGSSRGKAA